MPTPAEIIAKAREKRPVLNTDTTTTGPTVETVPANLDNVPPVIRPIVEAVLSHVQPTIKPEQIRAIVDDAVLRLMPKPRQITLMDREGNELKKLDITHRMLPELIEALQLQPICKQVPFLVGPAGSAKTTACEQAAEILSLDAYVFPVGPQTSKGDLIGFVDAHGRPVWTGLRKAYTEGGLVGIDEVDAGNPGVLTIGNSLISQDSYMWPDGTITKKHENFRICAMGNTFGTGANLQYIGRNPLDAATLDRFTTIIWDYDPELEKALALRAVSGTPGAIETAEKLGIKWVSRVQTLRKAAEKAQVRVVFSTRAIISGAVYLARGKDWAEVEERVIWRSGAIPRDDRDRIVSHA